MKSLYPVVVTIVLACVLSSAKPQNMISADSERSIHEFYVSPAGSDSNPGSKKEPFLTIQRAQKAVREQLSMTKPGDITVWLADGTYALSETLHFGPEDSGQGQSFVHYRAEKGANPVISGGMEIKGWQRKDGFWIARVPPEISKQGFRELFIDGKRATRARHPNSTYLHVAEVGADRRTNFRFNVGDFPKPRKIEDVELVVLHDWSISRIPLAGADYTQNRLTAVDSIGAKGLSFFNLDNWEKNPRYFLENDLAFLDAPGEWFFDADEGLLYLLLPAGKTPQDFSVTVPFTGPHLIVMEGSQESKVRNIAFEGIAFQYCSWQIPEKGYAGIQACHFDPRPASDGWSVVPAAVMAAWAENCSFSGCSFTQLGGSGLWFGMGCKECSVSGSHFGDISGNAIMIGEGRDRIVNGEVWWKSVPEQAALGNSAIGNTVTECGRQFYGAVGIWCGFSAGTLVSENHLYNLPYTGISIGWEWSPAPSPCRDNHLTGNHIHHIMQILSDGGGIYMLGLQPGSTISDNLIHDVTVNAGRAESNGMFLDEGTTDVTVAGNIIYHIAKSPLRFHRATTNLVRDNVLSCGEGVPPVRYNATKVEDIRLENNLILRDSENLDRKLLEEAVAKWHGRR
jgi:hypothetical protein